MLPPLILLAILPTVVTALAVPPPVYRRQDPSTTSDPTNSTDPTDPFGPGTVSSSDSDPCAELVSKSLSSVGDLVYTKAVHDCYAAVPFSQSVKDNVLEVISKVYNLDILEFNQLNAPEPIPQNLDVRKELARINSTTYESDFALQIDLYKTFLKLNDGHHQWTSCYLTSFGSFVPVPVVGVADSPTGGSVKYYISPEVETIVEDFEPLIGLQTLYTKLGIDFSIYAGKEISKIDGMPVADFVDFVADNESGVYQDKNQRRNAALSSYSLLDGTFTRTFGDISQPQYSDRTNITFSFADSSLKDLSLDYLSRPGTVNGFRSTTQFFDNNCRPQTDSSSASDASARLNPLALYPERGHGKKPSLIDRRASSSSSDDPPSCAAPRLPIVTLPSAPQNSSQYLGGRLPQFFLLDKNATSSGRVGVLYLPSFTPSSGCTDQFLNDLNQGLQAWRDANVTRIIVDVTGNGGGSVALALIMENLFSGSTHFDQLGFQSVMRNAPLSKKLVQAHIANTSLQDGSFGPDNFRTPDGKAQLSPTTDLFADGSTLNINGNSLQVSQPLLDTPQALENLTDSFFAPENVIIYSNGGTCGSSCASFTLFATEYGGISHVVSTVSPANETIEFQSFAAGQVLQSDAIYAELELTGLSDDADAPPPLVVQATLGVAFRATFGRDSKEFNQYISRPANATFALTLPMYQDPIQAWNYVAKSVWPSSDSSASKLSSSNGLTIYTTGQALDTSASGNSASGSKAADGGKKTGGASASMWAGWPVATLGGLFAGLIACL